jgi:hypothetical protein
MLIIIPIGLIVRLCILCCQCIGAKWAARKKAREERDIERAQIVQVQPTAVVTQHVSPVD